MKDAVGQLGPIIRDAGDTAFLGAIVGLAFLTQQKQIGELHGLIRELNNKTDMIKSIQKLQESHPCITYRFVVERAYVRDSTQEDRQTILNGLIDEGILTTCRKGDTNSIEIKPDNPQLLDYWNRIETFRTEGLKLLKKHQRGY